jgi:hypothetical protein
MIEVSLVPTEYVNTCWGKLESFVNDAAEATEGRYTTEDLYMMARNPENNLWIAYDESEVKGFVLTSINTYPHRKILAMNFCGGKEFDSWKTPIIDTLKRFAKEFGCDSIEAYGRKGWAKILKDEGYKSKFVTFELSI